MNARALFTAITLAAPAVLSAQSRPIAIRGGTVITMAGPRIANGTVLIRNGKIAAVGAQVRVPADAMIVDARGKFVMPGLIDAMSYYGIPPEFLNDDEAVTPELNILHGYYPFGRYIDRAGPLRVTELLAGGVTTQYVAPGDATVVGGQGAVVKTAGNSYRATIVRSPAAIDITIGERPARIFRAKMRPPSSREGVIALLRDELRKAKEYDGTQRRDLRMEALSLLLAHRIPARIQANRPEDIRDAIALAGEFGFDMILDGGSFAYQVRDELAARKIPVVLGPTSRTYSWTQDPPQPEEFPEPEERSAGWLTTAGVKVAIASFAHPHYMHADAITGKWILLEAMLASAYGLSEEDALKSVTINAAQILGVADRVGSLAPGKDADVIILSGPPRSILALVERVYVNGDQVYAREMARNAVATVSGKGR